MSHGSSWSVDLRAGDQKPITLKSNDRASLSRVIADLTEKLCGSGSSFCTDKAIEVKFVAPDAPDLTIIDLPGIVRTATQDQEPAVIASVDSLLKRYLEQERTIILAVIPCNVDIATVDILERAQRADPDGNRTFVVLTKPDLVDDGAETSVLSVLSNIAKPLRHGYVMVKNRSQKELDSEEGAKGTHHDQELAWFAKSPYKRKGRLGVAELTETLTNLLVSQIKLALPKMAKEADEQLLKLQDELNSLGIVPQTPSACRTTALGVVRSIRHALMNVTNLADYDGDAPQGSEHFALSIARRVWTHFILRSCSLLLATS